MGNQNQSLNILIVEDSKTINNLVAKNLKGHNVSQAFNLQEAFEYLSKQKYDLIILDMHLPDGDGIDLLDKITSLVDTKIIVLSADSDVNLREELFKRGIVDYIIKDSNLLYSLKTLVKFVKTLNQKRGDILVVDDSSFVIKQIEKVLTPRNYTIYKAKDGKEAKEQLKNRYDLILLDLEFPDIHGIKLIEYIRKKGIYTPIIVLSAYLNSETVRDILKKGGNDFLKKPFVFEELILRVDLWVDYYKKSKELECKTRELNILNKNLKIKIEKEVEKNRKKDMMLSLSFREAQLGEIFGFIIHQFKQPLNIINLSASYIEMMVNQNCKSVDLKDFIEKIKNSVIYLDKTLNEFRDFLKPNKQKVKTNFEKIVNEALKILDYHLKTSGINLEVKTINNAEIEVIENELIQVVINIVTNAIDILKERNVKDPKVEIVIDGCRLLIKDNAGGVKGDINKIFESYFTTKKNGTGLGLYMSKIIVEEHLNGKILVRNVDDGAEFEINLCK